MRDRLPITDAGMVLRMPYSKVRDLAMRGELSAQRDERGRWAITVESIREYQRRKASSLTTATA
jgi:hypothetical protein